MNEHHNYNCSWQFEERDKEERKKNASISFLVNQDDDNLNTY
jgi:hypothetical protein